MRFVSALLPAPGTEDLRSFDWYYLWRVVHSDLATINETDSVATVAVAPDGNIVATATAGGKVRLYDPSGGLKQALPGGSNGDQFVPLAFTSPETSWDSRGAGECAFGTSRIQANSETAWPPP